MSVVGCVVYGLLQTFTDLYRLFGILHAIAYTIAGIRHADHSGFESRKKPT